MRERHTSTTCISLMRTEFTLKLSLHECFVIAYKKMFNAIIILKIEAHFSYMNNMRICRLMLFIYTLENGFQHHSQALYCTRIIFWFLSAIMPWKRGELYFFNSAFIPFFVNLQTQLVLRILNHDRNNALSK